ncbi:hypothetical protein ON010_g3141 [Phytophthora cinnamomi]|nr:hypothetical protein ON010_g3141 [Phytophthora cinnamomi]
MLVSKSFGQTKYEQAREKKKKKKKKKKKPTGSGACAAPNRRAAGSRSTRSPRRQGSSAPWWAEAAGSYAGSGASWLAGEGAGMTRRILSSSRSSDSVASLFFGVAL